MLALVRSLRINLVVYVRKGTSFLFVVPMNSGYKYDEVAQQVMSSKYHLVRRNVVLRTNLRKTMYGVLCRSYYAKGKGLAR